MGNRITRRGNYHVTPEDLSSPGKNDGLTSSDINKPEERKQLFLDHVYKIFKRQTQGNKKLEICGKADKYPYWLSAHDLQSPAGDIQEQQPTIENYLVKSDRLIERCKLKVPTFLMQQLNKTTKLVLKIDENSETKLNSHPESAILRRSVRRLFLHIGIDQQQSPNSQLDLKITVYEQHNRNRKSPLLRTMHAVKLLQDRHGNFAIMGKEFILTMHNLNMIMGSDVICLNGLYLRSMDTCPRGLLTYHYKQTGIQRNFKAPNVEPCCKEYARRLLIKKNKSQFNSKISEKLNALIHKE